MPGAPPVIQIDQLEKQVQGLRPLRLRGLIVEAGERVAISGLDASAAEALVNLIAGATLPDTGDVRIFDASTNSIESSGDWFQTLDRFGVVTHRTVLLEAMTTIQNIALPMTIRIDALEEPYVTRARDLAEEVGLVGAVLSHPVSTLPPADRARVHLARALALDPQVLLLEHLTAGLDLDDVPAFARDVASVAEARGMAVLSITNDLDFASVSSQRVVRLRPANGDLEPVGRRRWPQWIRALEGRR